MLGRLKLIGTMRLTAPSVAGVRNPTSFRSSLLRSAMSGITMSSEPVANAVTSASWECASTRRAEIGVSTATRPGRTHRLRSSAMPMYSRR